MIENLKFAHDLKFEILEMNLSHELGVAFTSFCNQRNILITWDFKWSFCLQFILLKV